MRFAGLEIAMIFFFSSRRRHTRFDCDWSSDVCSSDLTDNWGEMIMVAGHPAPKMSEEAGASWDRVSANYLQNFGVPVLRGRGFTTADNETTAPVAVVNETFVKRFFKSDEDPLAQHFGLDLPQYAGTFRVVGV